MICGLTNLIGVDQVVMEEGEATYKPECNEAVDHQDEKNSIPRQQHPCPIRFFQEGQ